jgi:CDP-paratose 2-epimerase
VAWFVIAAETGKPITIYGDGKQVRDVLYIDDLLDVFDAAVENIGTAAGQVFNIGGGAGNTLAIWSEFGPLLEDLRGDPIPVRYGDWRPGDQRIYVSDIRKAQRVLDWSPKKDVTAGVEALYRWVHDNRELFNGRGGGG